MILKGTVDAATYQGAPTRNYGTLARLALHGSGSSSRRYVYMHFTKPFPANSVITTGTLRFWLSGAWSGTNDLTIKRIGAKWGESTITYNNAPAAAGTGTTYTVTSGTDEQMIEIDISTLLQAAANGSAYFGVRIELDQNSVRYIRSGEDANPDLRPEVELDWSEAPDPPDRLSPADDMQVNDEFPVLAWRFADHSGTTKAGTTQAYSQVQIVADPTGWVAATGFPTPDYDTGQVANVDDSYDLNDGSFTGVSVSDELYWTVSVWDGTGFQSEFSQPVLFGRTALSALTIDNPNSTVPETTPPVSWTFGGTQDRYLVVLQDISGTKPVELWRVSDTGTVSTVTIPNGLLKATKAYRVYVHVWDTVNRWNDEHAVEHQDFTYVRDGSPDPVLTLVAITDGIEPSVTLTWTRTDEPDYWCITAGDVGGTLDVVDGLQGAGDAADRIVADRVFVSGTTYSMKFWGASPRKAQTYEVEAVVLDSGVYKHSSGNAQADATINPVGIWLTDPNDDKAVMIAGVDAADFVIGETGTTYDLVGGRAPVRIVDSVRGYEGTVSGLILTQAERRDFLTLKGRRTTLQLIIGDLSVPIQIEEAHVTPTPVPGDAEYSVSFTFFQVGAPWPTVN